MISSRDGGTSRGSGAGGTKGSGRMSIAALLMRFPETEYQASEQRFQLGQPVIDQPAVIILLRKPAPRLEGCGTLRRTAGVVEGRSNARIGGDIEDRKSTRLNSSH